MNRPENIHKALQKQSNEHKIIFDYVARFDSAMINKDHRALLLLIKHMVPFLQKDLIPHFNIEEKYFYPALLHAFPTEQNIQVILQLQFEHGMLNRDLHWMTPALEQTKTKNPSVDQELLQYLRPFLYALKTHEQIEMGQLFPRIDRSQSCRAWISQKIASAL